MNDMEPPDDTLTHKYIDDITISESISCSNVSVLQTAVDKVKAWSDKNNMKLNESKTKEMLISFKQNLALVPPLIINSNAVERIHTFKYLVFCHLMTHLGKLMTTICTQGPLQDYTI